MDAHGPAGNLQWHENCNCTAMHSPFVDSASSLSGEYAREPLEPSAWGRLLTVAVVLAVAACSAALLVQ